MSEDRIGKTATSGFGILRRCKADPFRCPLKHLGLKARLDIEFGGAQVYFTGRTNAENGNCGLKQLTSAHEALMKKLAHSIWKFRFLLFALMAFGSVQAISQESTPNLSGIWRWNPDKSHVSGPSAANRRVKIEQQGSDLTVTTRVTGESSEGFHKYHYIIGSDDNTNILMGFPLKSKVQWKDGSLAVESVTIMATVEVHLRDTWTLSPDRQTLTFHESRVMGDRPPKEDTIVYEKQPGADWDTPKPAEEAFKNIQVFRRVPAPEMVDAMRSFTRALGVKCDFCHVAGAFDKDDKPEKQTARKMVLMARQINKDNFGGEQRVTCATCHRGATEPESAPK